MEIKQNEQNISGISCKVLNIINSLGSISSLIALVIVIIQIAIPSNNNIDFRELIQRTIFCFISIFAASTSIFYVIIKIRKIVLSSNNIENKTKKIFITVILFLIILYIFIDGIYCSITNEIWLSDTLYVFKQFFWSFN